MKRARAWLADLPRAARWVLLAGGATLLLVAIASGAWTWAERREVRAQRALATALTAAHQAVDSGQAPELESAGQALEQFLNDHPRSRAAAQAWYTLGHVEFRRGRWDAAVRAFGEASGRDSRSIGALSRLGQGYAHEAKGEPAKAIASYERALMDRGPRDFLYGELLLAKARAHEQAKDPAAAIATYRRYLKDLSERADEVRIRLALLGGAG